jgi:hypothetical protein
MRARFLEITRVLQDGYTPGRRRYIEPNLWFPRRSEGIILGWLIICADGEATYQAHPPSSNIAQFPHVSQVQTLLPNPHASL